MRLLCKLVLISFYRVGSYIGFNSNRYSDREEVLWCFAVDTDGGESDRPFLADCWTCNYELKNVDYEVRAGLSSVYDVPGKGWVADDIHSESASRTLDYACMIIFVVCFSSWAKSHSWQKSDDDYAAYILALHLGKPENITDFLYARAMRAPFLIYNNATGFMEARNANGSWAGPDNGWTEGMCMPELWTRTKLLILWRSYLFVDKVINGLIRLMWCMIYLR